MPWWTPLGCSICAFVRGVRSRARRFKEAVRFNFVSYFSAPAVFFFSASGTPRTAASALQLLAVELQAQVLLGGSLRLAGGSRALLS
jgi:hypothetical protein